MDILRIAVLGIAGVLLALLLQKKKSEYSMFYQYGSLHLHFYLYYWKGGDCHQFCKKKCRRLLQWIRRISH